MEIVGRKFKTIVVKDETTAKEFEDYMNKHWKIVTTATLGDKVMFLMADK